jgi:hypothetical protein
VLSKKPGEADTPEETAVRASIRATVKKAMKSARERQNEILTNSVTYRGLTSGPAMEETVKDVQTRGVKEGTFEEPSQDGKSGTTAMYVSAKKQEAPKLLVTIPLKSILGQR